MRPDLIIAIIVAAASVMLASVGFFLLDWGLIPVGLLIAVMAAADAYLVVGLIQSRNPPVP